MQALGLSHLDDGSDEVQGPDEGVEEALFPDTPLDEVQVLVHHDLQEAEIRLVQLQVQVKFIKKSTRLTPND